MKKNKIIIFHGALESNNKGCEALSLGLLRFMQVEIPGIHEFQIQVYGLVKNKSVIDGVSYHPFPSLRDIRGIRNLISDLKKAKTVLDIGYGDGFSDIYGFRRIRSMTFYRILAIRYSKSLILTPQTIGPFYNWKAKLLGKYILSKSKHIFSRDYISKSLVDSFQVNSYIAPDLAFFLKPNDLNNDEIIQSLEDKPFIGINISGLLWNKGYTGTNEFGLYVDYKETMIQLINKLIKENEFNLILVPHSFSKEDSINFKEDDYKASLEIVNLINHPSLSIIPRNLNSAQIKFVISKLNFFVGSRMHSCVAALSSNIPCIALSYSRKFHGLFSYLGYGNLEINLKSEDVTAEKVVFQITEMIKLRKSIEQLLVFNNQFVMQKFIEFKNIIKNEIV